MLIWFDLCDGIRSKANCIHLLLLDNCNVLVAPCIDGLGIFVAAISYIGCSCKCKCVCVCVCVYVRLAAVLHLIRALQSAFQAHHLYISVCLSFTFINLLLHRNTNTRLVLRSRWERCGQCGQICLHPASLKVKTGSYICHVRSTR